MRELRGESEGDGEEEFVKRSRERDIDGKEKESGGVRNLEGNVEINRSEFIHLYNSN